MKRILALLLFLSPAVQAIVIDNGIAAGTVGHFSVDVLAGGDTNNATITARRIDTGALTTTDVVFRYTSFVDPGQDGGGIPLSASQIVQEPTLNPNDPNTVTSSGIFTGQFGQVFWEATSSIRPGSQAMTTRYLFSALGAIGSLRVLQYLDEDVNPIEDVDAGGFLDNVFLPLGSADFGDLSLYTFGNLEVIGVRQAGSESFESFFAGWAAAPFSQILNQIQGSGQPVAREGVIANLLPMNHPQLGPSFGPADITSVLAWDINPNTFNAEVITVLGGEDAAPVPPVASFVATPATGFAPLTVAFNGSGSSDSDGAIVTYRWNFGDGTPLANGPIQNHTYTVPGTYSAQLVVRDDSGLVGSSIQQIGVAVPDPIEPPAPGPPPATPANPGDPIVCQGRACGVPLTCNLDAECTIEATIFVRTRGGRLTGDAAVRASRTIRLASSVTSIPPRQTASVKPRLTKRGKDLLRASRAGGKKRFNGMLQLRNVVTGAVISNTPFRVRLR